MLIVFRMRQETKHLVKTYTSIENDPTAYYKAINSYPANLDPSGGNIMKKNQTGGLDMTHDCQASYPDQCTCATLPTRYPSGDRQSIYNYIQST